MFHTLYRTRNPFIRFLNHGPTDEVFYLKAMVNTNSELRLGSGSHCTIQLSEKKFVEDHHVTLSMQGNQIHIWPKDPSYPIYINDGISYQPRCLQDGDRVKVGEVEFELRNNNPFPIQVLSVGFILLMALGLFLRPQVFPTLPDEETMAINCVNAEDFNAMVTHVLNPVFVAFTNMIRPDYYTYQEKQEKKAEIIREYFTSGQDTVQYFSGKKSKRKETLTVSEYMQKLIVRQEKCDCLIELEVEKIYPIQYNEALDIWDLKVKFIYGYKRSSFHRIQGGEGPIRIDYSDYNASLAHFEVDQVACSGKVKEGCCQLRIRKIEALETY